MPTFNKANDLCFPFLVFLVLTTCSVMGQAQPKKHITEGDYAKWGKLSVNGISDDGQWASYTMIYPNNKDTLFLQHTKRKLQYQFPKGHAGRFAGNRAFVFLSNDMLTIRPLAGGKTKQFFNVKNYEVVNGSLLLIWYTSDILEVRKITGERVERISDVFRYVLDGERNRVLYVSKRNGMFAAAVMDFMKYSHISIAGSEQNFESIQWQKNGESVLLSDGSALLHYRFSDMKLRTFALAQLKDANLKFAFGGKGQMTVADDGEKVFFNVLRATGNVPQGNADVEVWNGNDEPILPVKQKIKSGKIAQVAVWFPARNHYEVLTDESLSALRLSGRHDYAVLSNPHSYSLVPKYYEDVDFYLKDIKTGSVQLLIQKQSHDPNQLRFSPLNNDMIYYRDKNWWLYKPENNEAVNLTASVRTNWDNTSQNAPSQFEPYGLAGWSHDGKSALLYDSNDIWRVALDGTECLRLTRGKEKQTVYRISETEYENVPITAFEKEQRILLDLTKNTVLREVNEADFSTGYAILDPKLGLTKVCQGDYYASAIKKSATDSFIFSAETFSMPPQLQFVNLKTRAGKVIYRSNRQQANYFYGKSELIHYKGSKGEPLKGALYYPADYDNSKRYPMIVHVYEQQSQYIHRYRNPTQFNSEGFNVTNLTLNGYIVLLPDISYELGNPAVSAQICVKNAVEEVLSGGKVDRNRIGLIGHSFGGYEVNFIVAQSDLFAAAVSGAGVSDTVRYYFNLSANNVHENELWRFETQQFRMGTSFFGDKTSYLNNSPLMQLDKIKAPILLWAGKKDIVIPFEQSETLYLALRRLRHPTILLAFPEENHTIRKPENQMYLSSRILEWFDYYLKDAKGVPWITEGTSANK